MSQSQIISLLNNGFGKREVQRATGAAALAVAVNPGVIFALNEIRVHLSAVGAAGNLTVTIDNGAGAAYDTVVFTQDMTAVTDLVWSPDIPLQLASTDHIDIAWANAGNKTYGIEILYTIIEG